MTNTNERNSQEMNGRTTYSGTSEELKGGNEKMTNERIKQVQGRLREKLEELRATENGLYAKGYEEVVSKIRDVIERTAIEYGGVPKEHWRYCDDTAGKIYGSCIAQPISRRRELAEKMLKNSERVFGIAGKSVTDLENRRMARGGEGTDFRDVERLNGGHWGGWADIMTAVEKDKLYRRTLKREEFESILQRALDNGSAYKHFQEVVKEYCVDNPQIVEHFTRQLEGNIKSMNERIELGKKREEEYNAKCRKENEPFMKAFGGLIKALGG